MGIVAPVVHPVSGLPADTPSFWRNTKVAYDYAIGGLPFLSAASTQFPLERKTADYTKQQIDQTVAPGEQTLVAWWLRSQSSFHAGTGIIFEEPTTAIADTIQYRFQDSAGVNVWTPGEVSLLRTAPLDRTPTAGIAMGAIDSAGDDCYFLADGTALRRCPGDTTAAVVTWGGTHTIQSLTQDGTNYYAADDVGIYQGTLTGGAGSLLWNTGASPVVLGWVKSRLMAGIGPSIYELAGGAPPVLPTPLFTHPNPDWVWTSISESPGAIYAAGYCGSTSAIFMFVLNTSGAVPILTGGIPVAEVPEGEVIHTTYGYLGSYLVIGTNKGVRIADVQSDGSLQYGPLSVILPAGAGPVLGIVGIDRFIYGGFTNGIGGKSGLWRIDLGTSLGFKQFSYASDLQSHTTGQVRSVTRLGASDRLIFTVDGDGARVQSVDVLEATGFLKTGNIRYHILEPKLFKFVRVWSRPLTAGSVSITVNDHADNPTPLVTFTAGTVDDPLDEVALPSNLRQQEWVSLTIGLARDSGDTTQGPTVTAYQLKALPAQKRQRVFVVPLLCYDTEQDSNGAQRSQTGSAVERIRALEAVEEAGDIILFQDLTRFGQDNRAVVIDGLEFVQTAPPKFNNATASGWGGVIMATLRGVT